MLRKTGLWASRTVKILGIIVAAVVFVGLGIYWYSSRNANITKMNVSVETPIAAHFTDDKSIVLLNDAPDTNNNRDIAPADPLRILYDYVSGPGAPAFNTNISRSELAQNIKISPAIRGKWAFSNPYEIVFTPDADWPSDTKFNVKLGEKLFSREVRPNTRRISFKTAPITAKTDLFNIYPAPDGERAVVGVAVISFNYPIQTRDFADKVSMRLGGQRLSFDVKIDRYMRTAIIRTDPIEITDNSRTLRFKLNRIDDADGNSRTKKITASATIDSIDNFFKISDVSTITADDKYGNPQQLILVDMTSAAADKTDWNKYIEAYLLPRNADSDENTEESHTWANDEITADVIKKSEKIKLTRANFVNPAGTYQYAFSYDVSDNAPRYLYVTIKPDIHSTNGFVTKNGINRVMPVAYPERSVKIMGGGALLSLAGDKKLAIVARGGVDAAYVNLYKIESDSINHLITQTYNLFSDLEFRAPWIFDVYDMSSVFQKRIPFSDTAKNRVNYAALNLGEYLDRTYSDKTGIFIVKTGATKNAAEYGDARLILLTNLGIIRKINLDQSSVVFVSYLSDGKPASEIDVTVLGRNGYPIWAGVTDADGRADIPRLAHDEYRNEKEPVAIVARHGSDVSFIPYYADMAQSAEYSKFDIGGTYAMMDTPLKSFIFSDRGIYRPGETVTIGAIVENKTFSPMSEIPVKLEITDTRGRTILDKKVSLATDGMIDITHKLSTDAPLGRYEVAIYTLNGRGHVQDTIGTGNFEVQEFVPDTMKIIAAINNTSESGWISPNNLTANVSLNNLYGTPATDRRISAHATLRPIDFTFDDYRGYKFTSNFNSKTGLAGGAARTAQTFTVDPSDVRTDENGNATIDIKFDREIPIGTYMLNLAINGFEAGDGKSIQTILNSRVSNLKQLIGYKSDSDLNYMHRNSESKVKLIVLDASGHAVDADDITMKLIKRENLTSLLKDYDNHYKYQTISHDVIIAQSQISVSKNGSEIKLNTSNGGTFYVQLLDSNENILANIEYFVASDENIELREDSHAELQIKLDASSYKPGESINIGVIAPYAGTGLITIERDRVYAHKWFTTNTTSSTQKITLPADFEGTGYVNVSFVRDINSHDIFTTPYTYAVAPFSTSIDKHKINVKLDTPKTVRDNKLPIEITTDTDARIMLFAVNTGILQVANYSIPNPLKHFFQKAALQVETYQILSLLLPEYNVLREVAKIGGSDYSDEGGIDTPLTNPFGRKTLPPVAFYSGIINTTANTAKTINFDIPEYFNGGVSVYAVAAAPGRVGAVATDVRVQSPVIISVSAPLVVAPNDKFTVNTIISNLANESGNAATARNDVTSTGKLLPIEKSSGIISLPENTERLWTFNVTAADTPGTGTLDVSTTLFDDKNHSVASRRAVHELSIRPATMFRTDIKTGILDSGKTSLKITDNIMYNAEYSNTLYISKSLSILARPMFMYLKHYEFDCTEQLVSRTLPYVIAPEDKLFGTNRSDSTSIINKAIQTLSNRQNGDGSFGMWSDGIAHTDNETNPTTAYLTAYTLNFLSLARRAGFNVPQSMFSRGIDFLRTYAGLHTTSVADAHAKAFTIYTLSLNDYVTTSYIDLLEEYLNENVKDWDETIIGAYIAASYKMLKQTDKSFNLISKYKSGKDMYDGQFAGATVADATYTFIARNYFDMVPERATKNIQNYINRGNYDSFTAAAIVIGTANIPGADALSNDVISVFADDKKLEQTADAGTIIVSVPNGIDKLRINCETCKSKDTAFYTLVTTGFPKTVVSESNGIDVTREYYNANGERVTSAEIGDILDVKITARTRGGTQSVDNAVIADLLPGGFIPISDSVSGDMIHNEIREDRVLIYTTLSRNPTTFKYRVQLSVAGEFTVPPITAMDMYNSEIRATTDTGKFNVSNAKD